MSDIDFDSTMRKTMLQKKMAGLILPFGMHIRSSLFPSELDYFRNNPHTAGMAADDNYVILNPYSSLSQQELASVANNEAARLYMRQSGFRPSFTVTDEQRRLFARTPYEHDEQALRDTIAARLFSGDPSALNGTSEQLEFVSQLRQRNMGKTE
ncbi:MAG: hypothetical protein VW518_00860 [Burkholderiaceae bacterium]